MNLASSVASNGCHCNLELHGKQTALSVSEHKKQQSHKCTFKVQDVQNFFFLEGVPLTGISLKNLKAASR